MKHFKNAEFNCLCCGKNEMNQQSMAMFNLARDISGIPYVITSGYRCAMHNAAVGSITQNHVLGFAADIRATTNQMRGKILRGLYRAGFKRIGIHADRGFIHADLSPSIESLWGPDGT